MTDPIADMLTRIRNAVHARHPRVDVPASTLKLEIARILEQRATSRASRWSTARPTTPPVRSIRMLLKYGPRGERVITGIERVSRPGRRVYFGREDVPTVLGGLGTAHPDDVARRDDRPRGAQAGRRRRSALQRLVSASQVPAEIGKKPDVRIAEAGVQGPCRASPSANGAVEVQGPKGKLR